jgi:CBS-domain-containing membrane protein
MDSSFVSIAGSTPISELLARIEQESLSVICCVDDDGKYLGTADPAIALRARAGGVERVEDAPLYVGDTVWLDTVLDDLVPAGLRAQHPLAVLDATGVLVGVIPLERLARAMVSDEAAVAATEESEASG